MVTSTERDGRTWYECERCGLLMEDEHEAAEHERTCDGDEPGYLQ